ncbi:hypothetical protein ACFQ08_15365 [Streptosporangium algeriense]|uniref:Uncharacterized protein n=1 Tax=Streptosporangium algeriense TaxID=1682748 RepID=A0ABW3DSD3_9ACTN
MRRSTITFATLVTAAATAAALVPAGPAMAATGYLDVGGIFRNSDITVTISLERYVDPAPSCYVAPPVPSHLGGGWRHTWQNNTDSKIVVYPSTDCTDPALTTVPAHGGYAVTNIAKSFEVLS